MSASIIEELALRHPTQYERLVEIYRENAAFLSIAALYAVLRSGTDQIGDSTTTNIFSGYPLLEDDKTAALKIARLMAAIEPDVLMAFVQRVMLPFQDHQGDRIPYLHPYGDEETACPVCGKPGIEPKVDELMTTDDGGIAEWRGTHCGAKGCAKYLLAFERHVMVVDGEGHRLPNRKWDI